MKSNTNLARLALSSDRNSCWLEELPESLQDSIELIAVSILHYWGWSWWDHHLFSNTLLTNDLLRVCLDLAHHETQSSRQIEFRDPEGTDMMSTPAAGKYAIEWKQRCREKLWLLKSSCFAGYGTVIQRIAEYAAIPDEFHNANTARRLAPIFSAFAFRSKSWRDVLSILRRRQE